MDGSQYILICYGEKVFIMYPIVCYYDGGLYGGTDQGKLLRINDSNRVVCKWVVLKLVAAAKRKKSASSHVYSVLCFNLSQVVSKSGILSPTN